MIESVRTQSVSWCALLQFYWLKFCNQTLVWRSLDRASLYISTVKPTRCTIFELIEYHSTCFGRSFRPSSGVQDYTHSIMYMSYRLVDSLLVGTRWSSISCPLASSHLTCITCTWCSVCIVLTPDDGRKDRPKHLEWYSINSKIVYLVGFTIGTEAGCCQS